MKSNPRTGRRWRIAALVIAIAAAGGLLLLPTLLSRTVARQIFNARAGRLLAPGSLQARSVHLSWFGPTRLDGVVLRDGQGARLIAADRAVVGWGLWQILFARPEAIPLNLPGADLAIGCLPDGRIDLFETLRPIIREHPRHRLIVEIPDGRLRLTVASLAQPIDADRADIRLEVPRDPDPIRWRVALERRDADGREPGRAVFQGLIHREPDRPSTISLTTTRWPWTATTARVAVDGRLTADRRDGRWTISGDATAAGPVLANRPGPLRAAWKVNGRPGDWSAHRLELAIPEARIAGSGTIRGAGGGTRLDLKGTVEPDWEAIRADLRRDVEPSAQLAGGPGTWRLSGPIGGDDLVGELGIHLETLDVFGLRLAKTDLAVRSEGGRLQVAPIDARLNDGVLHLEPQIVRSADGPFRIRLGASSTLANAVINDEVSHRVLSYVAPVLDGATRVRGRVSVRGLEAEFPIDEAIGPSARVTGDVVFDDVRFLPGPLAEAIVDLLPNAADPAPDHGPMLVLRDPISFRIADRKVYQHGLSLPLGRIGTATLEGSVDFEKRLDLTARFRINPPRADRSILAALLNGARLELPIRGTLRDPRIDADAFKARLQATGSDLLEGSIVAGAGGLLRLLDRSVSRRREVRDPPDEAPPPPGTGPTPEERREQREQRRRERLEKKAQRRIRRGGPPG